MVEAIYQKFSPIKYSREVFECFDGGTIGLDWLVHPCDEQESERDFEKRNDQKRPLIVFVPGLSGTSEQLYAINLAKHCIEKHLDMVVINYRGLAGVPMTVSIKYCSSLIINTPPLGSPRLSSG